VDEGVWSTGVAGDGDWYLSDPENIKHCELSRLEFEGRAVVRFQVQGDRIAGLLSVRRDVKTAGNHGL
jgi:hypothetical protein